MRKYNLFSNYTNKKIKRLAKNNYRTIENRIIATYRNKEFFDGDRKNGYGGYVYDGRWKKYAKKIINRYKLNNKSKILQINSEKGFILNEIQDQLPKIQVFGTESSKYAIKKTMTSVKSKIYFSDPTELPFKTNYFDFVLAIGVIYALNLTNAIKCLKEINRVSKKKSFINLASYSTNKDLELFNNWSLLGVTFLKENEWVKVLKHVKYKGDFYFTNSKSLGLK